MFLIKIAKLKYQNLNNSSLNWNNYIEITPIINRLIV